MPIAALHPDGPTVDRAPVTSRARPVAVVRWRTPGRLHPCRGRAAWAEVVANRTTC